MFPPLSGIRGRASLVGAGLLAVAGLAWLLREDAPADPATDPLAMLTARAVMLERQLELIADDARYLVLDPERGTLTLFHGGAPLRSWTVEGVGAGVRRWRTEDDGWRARRWEGARVEPPVERDRRVIVSDAVEPPDLAGAVDWIPPMPEDAVPVPRRFVIHYRGGMGLEVVAQESDSARFETRLLLRAEHRLRLLLPRNRDRYRIRVRMPAEAAGALYRALPDSSALLAIIPGR